MKKYFDNMVFCALRRVCGACKKGGDGMAGEKILIVDDDKNICELLRLYLEKEGYAVTQAYDGEAAFEAFEREKPNLVLLDVMMPKMDGWEVCRKIREKGNTPVIMLTAKGETFDKVLGLELGADDYVVKPFDSKEVVARIKAVLRRCAPAEQAKVKGKTVEAPPKSWSCCITLPATPTACSRATSCWTRCGGLNIMAIPAPSTYM